MFPCCVDIHDIVLFRVETVVLLSKGEVDSKKIRVEFSLEDMDMSEFQDGATYPQIKEYVLEHTGLKVSNLYISQIKRKCGIEVGKNYNLPKSEDSRQPQCPQEKEKAIREHAQSFVLPWPLLYFSCDVIIWSRADLQIIIFKLRKFRHRIKLEYIFCRFCIKRHL